MKGNLRNGTVEAGRYRLLARFRAAIFDFDETIIDLEEQHTIASIELCRAMGNDYFEMSEGFRHGSGKRVIDDVRDLRQHFGWQQPVDELLALRQKHFDRACIDSDLNLLPGAESLIRDLHARGKTLAVTSSAVRASIEAILERFDLRRLFKLIVDGSEVSQPKPHPEPYLLTAKKLGLPPAACVVFEDSSVGVQSAKAAGMFCVGVRNLNAKTKQDLTLADLVVDSLESFRVDPRPSALDPRP
jgi:beta-phosphoglucomutase